ncbi:MAG: thiamine pyrophosphate-dependent enzyme [Merdibacter sp.]
MDGKTLKDFKTKLGLPKPKAGDTVDPRDLALTLHEIVGEDAIIVTDVGQHQMIMAQYYQFSRPRSWISSCGLGTMGYGMGAAIGAKVANPHRPVILVTGDGSFHMNMNEMASRGQREYAHRRARLQQSCVRHGAAVADSVL